MAILLSSANETVMKRWAGLLQDKYDLVQADTLSRLRGLCKEKKFDLVLLHRTLIDASLFTQIRHANPANRIFLLSDKPNEDEGLAFLRLGIVGYANTYISRERLLEAVRVIGGGAVWLGQKVMQRLILDSYRTARNEASADSEKKLQSLTTREREIANLIAQGQSNLEIAANLDIAERTVKAHLSSIYEKTRTGSRLNLALLINRG